MSARFEVAVVGRVRDAAAVAAGAACVLASRSASRTALVVGTGEILRGPSAPATAPARRLRERLCARDLDARASGRIVWCVVAGADRGADAARAAAVGGPVVFAVCGPREPWVESLLEESGLVLVAGDDEDPLTVLALEGLRARGLRAAAAAAPEGAGALLARIGLGGPTAWRSALPIAVGERA